MSTVALTLEVPQQFTALVERLEAATQRDIQRWQVDLVCSVVRDRLENHPESTEAELTAVATAAAKAVAAGVAALLAAPANSSGA